MNPELREEAPEAPVEMRVFALATDGNRVDILNVDNPMRLLERRQALQMALNVTDRQINEMAANHVKQAEQEATEPAEPE